MPKPKKGQTSEEFLKICIPQVLKEGTAKSTSQAVAICISKFKQPTKKSK